MTQQCDLCDKMFSGRNFRRRDYLGHLFCSIACVEAFEVRVGLPTGRVYEGRPGWSSFPLVRPQGDALPC